MLQTCSFSAFSIGAESLVLQALHSSEPAAHIQAGQA
jgi:hypothetical protein